MGSVCANDSGSRADTEAEIISLGTIGSCNSQLGIRLNVKVDNSMGQLVQKIIMVSSTRNSLGLGIEAVLGD